MPNSIPPAPPRSASMRKSAARVLATVLAGCIALPSHANTALADQPIFLTSRVPGNLALPLSVEFPTAVSVAHPDATYASTNTYLGYFDPNKCYRFVLVDSESSSNVSHFAPSGAATNRTCTGSQDHLWSGNFLNWATMQTIDPFRWALTGGYRVVDTPTTTILEKAWASGQGGEGNFPIRTVSVAGDIRGATPFSGTGNLRALVHGRGERVEIENGGAAGSGGFLATYFNTVDLDAGGAAPVLTRVENIDFAWGAASPAPGIVNADGFSVRWVATMTAPTTGAYRFQTVSDDGVRLYINGTEYVNRWVDRTETTDTPGTAINLTAGQTLNIRMEHYERTGTATARLRWQPPGAFSYSTFTARGSWAPPVRAKVCDPTAGAGGVEENCVAYANGNYKPEGLMQRYSKKIRYSVFGYLNDDNLLRDGGVLRAQQKFIGPSFALPGQAEAVNSAGEWDASTGVYVVNPDNITSAMGVTISNSGVLNYLNKFGQINRTNYKTFDPVGELYYAALRYYKNLGNVPAWTNFGTASAATRTTWADGFPVITSWNDPILYSCQKNFILGIGDVNTHADKNVPGGTGTANEPTKPSELSTDPFNARTATNSIGVMEGLGTGLGTAENWGDCCNNNSPMIAGLAYLANTTDIRPDVTGVARTIGKQTVQTYWLDVLEYQTYKRNNMYYLATKYGGFTVPDNYNPDTNTTPLPTSLWHTPSPIAAENTVGSGVDAQTRPNNYFVAARPDQMVDGLTRAFADIVKKAGATIASNALALPQVASDGGNASYSASWEGEDWTGELIANELTFANGSPVLSERWTLTNKLAVQLAGTGWDTNRRVITFNPTSGTGVPFRAASLSPAQQTALATPYAAGDTVSDYVNYLRGSRAREGNGYRTRTKLLGDIVGAKPLVVGPPLAVYSNSSNPGYSIFKAAQKDRPTVVYVGANDGFLHAVQGNLIGPNAGRELFAYAPGAVITGPSGTPATNGLVALGNPAFEHRFFVNATPTVTDIDFGKTPGGSGTNWRSVLIGGLGKGGKAYYAIDVTDPVGMITAATNAAAETSAAGKVLWEFTDSRLGFTYGEAVVVKTRQHGWVAILPSGYNNADGRGYLFVVNPRTGALIQAISTGEGSTTNDAGFAQITGFVQDRSDGTVDAVYGGDMLGNVWRFDLTTATGDYPAPTKLAVLTDSSGNVQPVTARPLVEVHPITKRRHVLIGTGRLLDIGDFASAQNQSFYSIIDGTTSAFNTSARLPSGISFPIRRSNLVVNNDLLAGVTVDPNTRMGWVYDLGSRWRLVSDMSSFFGTVTFTPTLPTGDDCSTQGQSRLFVVDFDGGETQLLNGNTEVAFIEAATLINDQQNLSKSGERVVSYGTVDGKVSTASTKKIPALPLRRLNWREVPVAN